MYVRVYAHMIYNDSYIYIYPNLPIPTLLWVLIINPSIDFIGTLQKSRFWRVKVYMIYIYIYMPQGDTNTTDTITNC